MTHRPPMAVLFGFLDWLAANVAYNGADDEGQRFYDWGVNAWLQEQAAEYLLAQPTANEAEGDEREALAEAIAGIDGGRLADASTRAYDACLRAADAVLAAGFRRRDPDAGLRERVEALARCCCNTGPGTEGPVQECPEHGDIHARFFLGDLLRAALATPPAPERNGLGDCGLCHQPLRRESRGLNTCDTNGCWGNLPQRLPTPESTP